MSLALRSFINKKNYLNKFSNKRLIGILLIPVITILGVNYLINSHAQSPYATINASTGKLTSPAQTISDSTASNGNAVQFGDYPAKYLGVQSITADIPNLIALHANSARTEWGLDTTQTFFTDTVGHDPTNTTETFFNKATTAHIVEIPLLDTYQPITASPSIYDTPNVWANAVVTWCKSFCKGGTFYNNNPSANGKYAPRILEMLNEPYGGWYRGGAVPPASYANMLIATRAALDNAGLNDIGILGATGSADTAWTSAVAAAGGYNSVIGLADHPYVNNNVYTVLPVHTTFRAGFDEVYYYNQLYNKDMYITEVGWCKVGSIDNLTCFRSGDGTNKEDNITAAIHLLATVPWLKDFNYFTMHDFQECSTRDVNNNCTAYLYDSYGLYDSTGAQTAAYSTYQTAAKTNGF